MPKKKLTRQDAATEEGLRQTGKRGAVRHPNLRAAQEILNQQAPPVNLPRVRTRPTGGRVGPDTTT